MGMRELARRWAERLGWGAATRERQRKRDMSLMAAASRGHLPGMLLALSGGARVDADWGGATALAIAAGNGHDHCVQALLKAGADIEARDSFGATPLAAAARADSRACVLALLAAGADAGARDNDGWTAERRAIEQGKGAAAAALAESAIARAVPEAASPPRPGSAYRL